jgi:mono/diheme cytochrome c family protein
MNIRYNRPGGLIIRPGMVVHPTGGMMQTSWRTGRWIAAIGGLGVALLAGTWVSLVPPSEARAGWLFNKKGHAGCGHPGCKPGHCVAPAGWAGQWYWMRSPDQEQRVIMSHYNRFCIRCHGVDGRGVWDIPDVPDFTDPRWQASRSDAQIVNILMEGRGAVMPTFRGTLTFEEAWAMAHYLRSFVPGTEVARPDVGRAATPGPGTPASTGTGMGMPPLPVENRPPGSPR